jgi:hypothetical protein
VDTSAEKALKKSNNKGKKPLASAKNQPPRRKKISITKINS